MHGLPMAQHFKQPEFNQLEITLFGSGYGESIVIHIGNGKWIIVDSLINRDANQPASLKYLEDIGIDISLQVISVIVTHWHDDHIRGISEIANKCPSAKFFISSALMTLQNINKFKTLILDSPASRLAHLNADSTSGVSEFRKLLDVLREAGNCPGFAFKDRLLIDEERIQVWSLSPHDTIFEKAVEAIIAQIPDKIGSVQRIKAPRPNYSSVVLWIKSDNDRILLGADLEENPEYKGWSLIISEKKASIIDDKARFFKISHHGSETGHHDKIWSELLYRDPFCLVAPFNRNPKLPRESDIARINSYTNNAYITSYERDVRYDIAMDRYVQRRLSARKATYVNEPYSYVRARKIATGNWVIETYGKARKLSSITR